MGRERNLGRVDRDLLQACRDGSIDAYDAFYRRHRGPVLAYLARRTGSPELAADLMAETFAQALATVTRDACELPVVPAAWLFTIARNLLVDSLRRGRVASEARHLLGLEPLVLDDDDIDRIAQIAEAEQYMNHLATCVPVGDLELLRDRLVDDIPYVELASRLGCSEAVVRKRVSRAIARARSASSGEPPIELCIERS